MKLISVPILNLCHIKEGTGWGAFITMAGDVVSVSLSLSAAITVSGAVVSVSPGAVIRSKGSLDIGKCPYVSMYLSMYVPKSPISTQVNPSEPK